MSNPSTTTTVPAKYREAVAAIRDVHDEASLWHLSDELVKVAPSGVADVERVVAAAKSQGIPSKSANTLRLYRDVAIRFPKAERVELVTFSAHREAIAIGDAKQARKVLEDLAAKHGPAGVTVTTVKQAVGVATGNVAKSKKSGGGSKSSTYSDIAIDLSKDSGKRFIAELDAMVATNGVTLDGMHAGLTAVLTEVEKRRSKAARRAATDKRKSEKVVDPKRSAAAKRARSAAQPKKAAASRTPRKKVAAGKAGDLRDL